MVNIASRSSNALQGPFQPTLNYTPPSKSHPWASSSAAPFLNKQLIASAEQARPLPPSPVSPLSTSFSRVRTFGAVARLGPFSIARFRTACSAVAKYTQSQLFALSVPRSPTCIVSSLENGTGFGAHATASLSRHHAQMYSAQGLAPSCTRNR
jgi:hypothetical protein